MKRSKCGRCFKEIQFWHKNTGWQTYTPFGVTKNYTHCWADEGDPPMLHDPAAPTIAENPMGRCWAS